VLSELGAVSPLLGRPRQLDPLPFHVQDHAKHRGIDTALGTDSVIALEHALS
jgi:hypothetical protein